MAKYQCKFNGRRDGAIGEFYTLPTVEVEADSPREAEEKARDLLYAQGYEHLGFVGYWTV